MKNHPTSSVRGAQPRARIVLALLLLVSVTTGAWSQTESAEVQSPTTSEGPSQSELEDLRRQIEELRAMVEVLREGRETRENRDVGLAAAGNDFGKDTDRFAEIERQIEILARELEALHLADVEEIPSAAEHGLGTAASKVYRRSEGLSIGGYGELLYESFADRRQDGSASGATNQIDALRAVLYFGYKFNDSWLFNSEIEVEHASTSKAGQVSAEFAYVDYLWKPALNWRAGLVLLPLGWVNEQHEPTLFLSAQRPNVERSILPSTWREVGAGVFGQTGPFSYRAYLVNGLDARGFSAEGLRGGRQKGSKAKADDIALAARLDFNPGPSWVLGAAGYYGNSGQDLTDSRARPIGVTTSIFDLHFDWTYRGWKVRGLYARASIDDTFELNTALGKSGSHAIGEDLAGFYLEVGYDLLSGNSGEAALTPFLRHEQFDTQRAVEGRGSSIGRDRSTDARVTTIGLHFRPLDELVLKLDYEAWNDRARASVDQWNLALGYVF